MITPFIKAGQAAIHQAGEHLFSVANAQENGLSGAFNNTLNNAATTAGYAAERDVTTIAGIIISIILSLLGTIFLIMIIYSGIKWMTAGGNEQAIEKAKSSIKQALIGTIVVVGAYALSYYFINFLFN